MGVYWRHYHVKNKKYGNFVSIGLSSQHRNKKNFCCSILWKCLHHMVILISQNRITDFFMILAWASPLIQQAGPRTYLEKSYGPLKLTCCVKNKDIAQNVAQQYNDVGPVLFFCGNPAVVFWGFPRAESSPSAHLRMRDHERNGWYLSLIFWEFPPRLTVPHLSCFAVLSAECSHLPLHLQLCWVFPPG